MGRNELFGSGGVNHRKIMFQSANERPVTRRVACNPVPM
jgi:hypothetical protein